MSLTRRTAPATREVYGRRVESGSSRLLVVPRPGGGWQLQETPEGPALGAASTKRDAVDRAAIMLERRGGGSVVVLTADGAPERTLTVHAAGPRPWWYAPPVFVIRWLLPALFAVQLVLRLVDRERTALDLVFVVFLAAFVVLGSLVAWRSRRLDRQRLPLDDAD